MSQKKLCSITGIRLTHNRLGETTTCKNPTNMSIDRIDSKKGYTLDNVQ